MSSRQAVDTADLLLPHDLPSGLRAYHQSPIFEQGTIPDGLKRNHRTKPGVWAVIHVLDGTLHYRIENPPSEQRLTPRNPGLVRPGEEHSVNADGPVRFVVEFYASPHAAQHSADPHA